MDFFYDKRWGHAFVRRALKENPRRLVIYSRDEQKQADMEHEFNHPALRFLVGDVRDRDRLELAMRGIETVLHAAAMKIIPTCERDPYECVRTNVFGAENVARAALRCGVARVMALSTDKAAAPLNLYGASKLAAEKLFVAANAVAAGNTHYSVVRYGNVVGSRGSVIPLFRRFVSERRETIPITHPAMTRFWITLEQAVEFVISSMSSMKGGEIYIPKLPSMKITDLATAIAPDTKQETVGIRPGEKVHETMLTEDESSNALDCGDRYILYRSPDDFPKPTLCMSLSEGFKYSSGTNQKWLSVADLRGMLL